MLSHARTTSTKMPFVSARRVAAVSLALLALVAGLAPTLAQKEGWSCVDGFWTQDGQPPSEYVCGGEKGEKGKGKGDADAGKADAVDEAKSKAAYNACSDWGFDAGSHAAVSTAGLERTCIMGPNRKGVGPRCWWTHVPESVAKAASKVPLVIDMHGGGGCVSPDANGFKAMADSAAPENAFITVWPQGSEKSWATVGHGDEAKAILAKDGKQKSVATWDDAGFLEMMIATIVKSTKETAWKGKVDATRVTVAGFSMGCMMSHRMILEKSNIIASMTCQGGGLTGLDASTAALLDATKTRYNILPTPVYITIGTEDVWMMTAENAWAAWNHWNGCSGNASTTNLSLAVLGNKPTSAVQSVASSCQAATAMIEVVGLGHTTDPRMSQLAWAALKGNTRPGALAALPAASKELTADEIRANTTASKSAEVPGGGGAKDSDATGCGRLTTSTECQSFAPKCKWHAAATKSACYEPGSKNNAAQKVNNATTAATAATAGAGTKTADLTKMDKAALAKLIEATQKDYDAKCKADETTAECKVLEVQLAQGNAAKTALEGNTTAAPDDGTTTVAPDNSAAATTAASAVSAVLLLAAAVAL